MPKRPASFVTWVEQMIHLPLGVSAEPGRIRLPVYMREIAESFAEPGIEKVVIQKSARVGFSTVLSSLIAWHMVRDHAAVLCVLPAEADARNAVVALEELFDASPKLRGRLPNPSVGRRDGRNTILFRRGRAGASVRLVGANAPRNLRAVAAKVVLIDECDALQDTEGDVIALAEARSLTFRDRRTIVGGTPLLASTSRVARAFAESDMRVYECRCPSCRGYAELRWQHFEWEAGAPETVRWRCPSCGAFADERHKPQMVGEGRWRALRPEARGVRGFRLNALVSALPHATWPKLAQAWEASEGDDERRKAFTNVLLGEPWSEAADEIDEETLAGLVEGFSLDNVPAEVLAVTCGVDVQVDRLEVSIVGHARDGTVFVLAHQALWGPPLEEDVWQELDGLLHQRWRHPHGGQLKVDAAAIDAGSGGHYDQVLRFAGSRLSRRIMAIKGASGFARPALQVSKTKKGRLFIVGVDSLKSQILTRLARGRTIRFSNTLEAHYFAQLSSERRVVRVSRGRPVARFERKLGARAEALDCLVYALAARSALTLTQSNFSQRADALAAPEAVPKPKPRTVIESSWLSAGPAEW